MCFVKSIRHRGCSLCFAEVVFWYRNDRQVLLWGRGLSRRSSMVSSSACVASGFWRFQEVLGVKHVMLLSGEKHISRFLLEVLLHSLVLAHTLLYLLEAWFIHRSLCVSYRQELWCWISLQIYNLYAFITLASIFLKLFILAWGLSLLIKDHCGNFAFTFFKHKPSCSFNHASFVC